MNGYPGSTLHQIGPYIGKMRPSLARQLVTEYSRQGDWLWDPFCGSGTIPLECRLLSRHVISTDINPYACALTRAKLHAPTSEKTCLSQLALAADAVKKSCEEEDGKAPQWVKNFYNSRTLKEIIDLMTELAKRKQYFGIGCLLSILHHQRPGFLSYPASHLIPYLRDRLYPRDRYPEAYMYRDPIPRLKAKIKRVLKIPPPLITSRFKVMQRSAHKRFLPEKSIDAVVTSPPYMDALDYSRDNRLRLWFLGVNSYKQIRAKEIRKISTFEQDMLTTLRIIEQVLKPGGACVLVLGDVTHIKKNYDVPAMIVELIKCKINRLFLDDKWVDNMPDFRRVRRNARATRKETILIFRRTSGR